jgi:hypothetical protein
MFAPSAGGEQAHAARDEAAGQECYKAGVLLPNADRAFIDPRKLVEYSLSPEHPVGAHKAVLFERILGITAEHAEELREILSHVVARASAAAGRMDEFGQRYTIDFTLRTATGAAMIRSAWIILAAEDFPRLTTCFVLPH